MNDWMLYCCRVSTVDGGNAAPEKGKKDKKVKKDKKDKKGDKKGDKKDKKGDKDRKQHGSQQEDRSGGGGSSGCGGEGLDASLVPAMPIKTLPGSAAGGGGRWIHVPA